MRAWRDSLSPCHSTQWLQLHVGPIPAMREGFSRWNESTFHFPLRQECTISPTPARIRAQLSLFVSADPKTQALLVKSLSKLVSLRIKRRGKKPFEIQLSVRFSRLFGGFVPLSPQPKTNGMDFLPITDISSYRCRLIGKTDQSVDV
ncbi:hypothetical protein DPX16_5663 [Anabarilius grahami]|uniref:Uncharacterized protein n=1 Tax=Anabarilius grahami TaxID=495550 RepID=A0A3N0YPY4_ANAGA|nr:hypothetical protein DPX16_5663 [Anabarilius grahami]